MSLPSAFELVSMLAVSVALASAASALEPGDLIMLEALDGKTYRYQLLDSQIVDTRVQSLSIAAQSPGLVLVTCYPFDARQTGGPLRIVMRAAYLPTWSHT